MRCAIYARYSTDMQRPTSIEDQILACRRFADGRGWTILEEYIYTDKAISGAVLNRPGYQILFQAAQAKDRLFDVVLVDDLSRLSRDELELIKAYRRFKAYGIRLISVSDGLDTENRFSKMGFRFKALLNELFLDDFREKIRRGKMGRFECGYSPCAVPYGYRTVPVFDSSGRRDRFGNPVKLGSRIEIEEAEAKIVRRIFRLYTDGYSLRAIADLLNKEDVPTPSYGMKRLRSQKEGWYDASVRMILRNEKYIGRWVYNRSFREKDPETGKRLPPCPRPPEEWIEIQREDLHIISSELWARAQERMKAVSEEYGHRDAQGRLLGRKFKGAYSPYLFSGLLRCGVCGGTMRIVGGGSYPDSRKYGCTSRHNQGEAVCSNGLLVRVDKLESSLLEGIKAEILHPKRVKLVTEFVNQFIADRREWVSQELERLHVDLVTVKEELANIQKAIRKGLIADLTLDMLQKAEGQKRAIEAKIQLLKAEAEGGPKIAIHPELVRQKLEQIRVLLRRDVPASRQELRRHLKQVTLFPITANGTRYYRAEVEATVEGILRGMRFAGAIAVGQDTPMSIKMVGFRRTRWGRRPLPP